MGPPTFNSKKESPPRDGRNNIVLHMEHAPDPRPQGTVRNSQIRSPGSRPSRDKPNADNPVESNQRRTENIPVGSAIGQDRQFSLLRDSLVFNHERLLQHNPQLLPENEYITDQNSTTLTTYNSTPHYTSLSTFGIPSSFGVTDPIEGRGINGYPIPKLYSVPNDPQTNPRDADSNYNCGTPTRSWLQHVMERRNVPLNNDEVQSALQKANLFNRTGGMSAEDSSDIPLTGTAASLHLPSPPTSPLQEGTDQAQKQSSATTVTTVYSYKCERPKHPTQTQITNAMDGADKPDGIPLPTLHQGEFIPTPNSRTPVDAPMEDLETVLKENFYQEENAIVDDVNNTTQIAGEDQQTEESLLPADNDNETRQKQQTDNVLTSVLGDYATDDELEDDATTTTGQLQPFFPNPADLKWPEPSYLRMTLPPKYHPFLASSFKKDCRIWLYKNRRGRKAREMLAGAPVGPKRSLINSYSPLKNQRNSIQASRDIANHMTNRPFSDSDDMDVAEDDAENDSSLENRP